MATEATDEQVERWILTVLDDFQSHDWDDAMIAVDDGLRRADMSTGPRQTEICLAKLIERGEIKETWHGDWAFLRRMKPEMKATAARNQATLFSVE